MLCMTLTPRAQPLETRTRRHGTAQAITTSMLTRKIKHLKANRTTIRAVNDIRIALALRRCEGRPPLPPPMPRT